MEYLFIFLLVSGIFSFTIIIFWMIIRSYSRTWRFDWRDPMILETGRHLKAKSKKKGGGLNIYSFLRVTWFVCWFFMIIGLGTSYVAYLLRE